MKIWVSVLVLLVFGYEKCLALNNAPVEKSDVVAEIDKLIKAYKDIESKGSSKIEPVTATFIGIAVSSGFASTNMLLAATKPYDPSLTNALASLLSEVKKMNLMIRRSIDEILDAGNKKEFEDDVQVPSMTLSDYIKYDDLDLTKEVCKKYDYNKIKNKYLALVPRLIDSDLKINEYGKPAEDRLNILITDTSFHLAYVNAFCYILDKNVLTQVETEQEEMIKQWNVTLDHLTVIHELRLKKFWTETNINGVMNRIIDDPKLNHNYNAIEDQIYSEMKELFGDLQPFFGSYVIHDATFYKNPKVNFTEVYCEMYVPAVDMWFGIIRLKTVRPYDHSVSKTFFGATLCPTIALYSAETVRKTVIELYDGYKYNYLQVLFGDDRSPREALCKNCVGFAQKDFEAACVTSWFWRISVIMF